MLRGLGVGNFLLCLFWFNMVAAVIEITVKGASHGDVIDLNRVNLPEFDVREFYVKLVSDLKARGL